MIRNIIVLFSFLVIFASCEENSNSIKPSDIKNPNSAKGMDKKKQDEMPKFEFEKTTHDFGKVVDGVKISYAFKFKNTGGSDLIIHTVNTDCGCTASEFTKKPVPPGGSGFVRLTFDSSNRKGKNHKTATIVSNTQPNVTVLKINADVISASEI
jgi:hypothetical protein